MISGFSVVGKTFALLYKITPLLNPKEETATPELIVYDLELYVVIPELVRKLYALEVVEATLDDGQRDLYTVFPTCVRISTVLPVLVTSYELKR